METSNGGDLMDKKVEMIGDKVTKNYYRFVAPQGEEVTGTIFIRKDLMVKVQKEELKRTEGGLIQVRDVPYKITVIVTI